MFARSGPRRDTDDRLWWQRLADGVADALCSLLRCFRSLFRWRWFGDWSSLYLQ
jgi:hypothetical protein